jgi:UDP-N-acetylglucosamine--N-acetylmuramyl-(pentapeptide) pyrophosphoryl-undecaprenol N-acetylglucosamine transferase
VSKTRSTLTLAVAGGGTGGHTYPALTTIEALRDRLTAAGVDLQVTWYGTAAGLEARIAAERGIPFRALAAGKIRRSLRPPAVARTVVDLFRVPVGVLQAVAALARTRPDVVLSTGGYVAVPVGLAARLTGRRLVVHEQITALGLANRLLVRFASAVALSHPDSLDLLPRRARARARITGNPIRPDLLTGNPDAARKTYDLTPDLPLVYVTGGAQGSLQINQLITAVLPDLLDRAQVVHQCGQGPYEHTRAATAQLPPHLAGRYHLLPYLSDGLADILAAADLVVARSGASTLAELTAIGKPAVLIPLMTAAGGEQQRNADTLADAGAAVSLASENATPDQLRATLLALVGDAARRQAMADAARSLGRPDARTQLANLLIEMAGLDITSEPAMPV